MRVPFHVPAAPLPTHPTTLLVRDQLTRYLRELLESDTNLQELWCREVSNFSRPASGTVFHPERCRASLRCVMWRNAAQRQASLRVTGMRLKSRGDQRIRGERAYQLYADLIRPAGEGALYQEFLRLKARLEAEGCSTRPVSAPSQMAAAHRDRNLPTVRLCEICSSPCGAGTRWWKWSWPDAGAGEDAPPAIVQAIRSLNEVVHPDVILVARGGGSIEDLWAFNDEGVARAIAASQAPVITGVGHETDFTIADFAADLRAPTPPLPRAGYAPPHDLRASLADWKPAWAAPHRRSSPTSVGSWAACTTAAAAFPPGAPAE